MSAIKGVFLTLLAALILTSGACAVTGQTSIQRSEGDSGFSQDSMEYSLEIDRGVGGIEERQQWHLNTGSIKFIVSIIAAIIGSGWVLLKLFHKRK